MNETKPTPVRPPWRTSWLASPRRKMILLLILGSVVLAEAVWAVVAYWQKAGSKPELLVYHLCVGTDQKLCPSDATFVRNQGEDTVARWAQRECAGYKARRIIVNEGPSKDCNCSLADVTCATEY